MVRTNKTFSTTQTLIVQNKVYEINPSHPERFYTDYEVDKLAEQGVPQYYVTGIDGDGDAFGMLTSTCDESEIRDLLYSTVYETATVYDLHKIYIHGNGYGEAEEVLTFSNR